MFIIGCCVLLVVSFGLAVGGFGIWCVVWAWLDFVVGDLIVGCGCWVSVMCLLCCCFLIGYVY